MTTEPLPPGFKEYTGTELAVEFLTAATVISQDRTPLGVLALAELLDSAERTVAANPPEGIASLLVGIAMLAAGSLIAVAREAGYDAEQVIRGTAAVIEAERAAARGSAG